jgi:hypothetical protein
MKIYIICPVRNGTPADVEKYVLELENLGNVVHFPPRDAPQMDGSGMFICLTHLGAMKCSDEVHVFWDVNSKGSHFDLGMAFALDKKIRLVHEYQPDGAEKSYVKVMKIWEKES